jgi:hypothetical protein
MRTRGDCCGLEVRLLLQKRIALRIQRLVLLLTTIPLQQHVTAYSVFRTHVCQKSNGVRDPRCQATWVKNIPVGARLLRSPLPWDPWLPSSEMASSHFSRRSEPCAVRRCRCFLWLRASGNRHRTLGGQVTGWVRRRWRPAKFSTPCAGLALSHSEPSDTDSTTPLAHSAAGTATPLARF